MSSNTNSLAEIISKAQNRAITAYLDKFQTADNIERAKDEAIAAVLALLPEKKTLKTDIDDSGWEDEGQKFCVECGQYEFEGALNCYCVGFNEAIDQMHTNFKGGQQ